MYIAGIHLSNNRLTEGIVTSSVIAVIATQFIVARKGLKEADEKGGPIKSMPTTLIGKLVTPIHAAAMVIPAVAYLTIVPLSGGVQPEIISRFSLPEFDLGETAINVLRLVGCTGLAATYKLFSASRSVLGQSFHHIGVREKPKIVSTGPYAVIRHPLYTCALAQQFAFAVAAWNYIPLVSFFVVAAAFIVKIPIEESLIEADPIVGPEFVEYKKKVTYRLIPGIW